MVRDRYKLDKPIREQIEAKKNDFGVEAMSERRWGEKIA